ncbi:uncharacterized protein LOC110900780 [Helianthus annuus]|uniref:uncharacterized protein LOC110900780 n=1 Tax=Helianthus annuus TaxID=4232 RepID=UPI000B8FECEA|nr:uncharacterized protein LOC110900780 [Helianthus annuus]
MAAVSVDAEGRSGGLVSIWDPELFKVDSVFKYQRFVVVSGVLAGDEERLNVINLYAPNDCSERAAFWIRIGDLREQLVGKCVIVGDCNSVRHEEESFIDRSGLLEYGMTEGKYTYISGNEELKMSKLDRFLVCHIFMSRWPGAKLEVLKIGPSDHCPVVLICDNLDFGPIPFKFFNSWTEFKKVEMIVRSCVEESVVTGKADLSLALLLKKIKSGLKKWRGEVRYKEEKEVLNLSKIAEEIEKKADSGVLSKDEKKLRVETRKKIVLLEKKKKCQDLHQKARVNWIKDGDENSAYFHGVINVNKSRNRINGLSFNGVWIMEPNLLKEEIWKWFKKQFAEPMRRRPDFDGSGLPKISNLRACELTGMFSEEEVKKAIWGCNDGKAPGPDGFYMKFFKKYWEFLKPRL